MALVPPRSPPPPIPGATRGLAYGGAVITFAFAGALATRTAWALCINPQPRTVCEIALILASVCQVASLFITGYLTATAFLPPPPPVTQFLLRTVTNWSHMIAVVLATYICLRRAQAIWVVAPRTSKIVAPIVSAAMVGVVVSARVAGTLSEINALQRIQDPPDLFSAQQFLRALVNFTAAGFALFSEGYITSIIVRFRRRSNNSSRRRSLVSPVKKALWQRVFSLPESAADRIRLAYALLICLTFLTQAGLQVAVMLRLTRFAPFHNMGWALLLIRIIEFRSELLASVLVQQREQVGGAGPSSSSRGPAAAPLASSATSYSGSFLGSSLGHLGQGACGNQTSAGDGGFRSSRAYILSSPAASVTLSTATPISSSGLHRSRSSVCALSVELKPHRMSSGMADSSLSASLPATDSNRSCSGLPPSPPASDMPLAKPIPDRLLLHKHPRPDPRRMSTAPGEVFSYHTMAVASVVGGTGPLI